ncbi:MAG: hypothetical protein K5945_00200 [Bacteroidaceae bacterium]|nr:hypothetical protein [Bacteroidaceae bacterium]
MDYTEVTPSLIYRWRKELDEFRLEDPGSIDSRIFESIQMSTIVNHEDSVRLILDIYNTAYYLLTLIELERHPVLYVGRYLKIANEVGISTSGELHNLHRYLEALTIAIVYNYLYVKCVQSGKEESTLMKKLWRYHVDNFYDTEWDGKARFLFFNNVIPKFEVPSLVVQPGQFAPRPILDAIRASSLEVVEGNLPYIGERIRLIPAGERKKVIGAAKRSIKQWAPSGEYSPYSTQVQNICYELDSLALANLPGSEPVTATENSATTAPVTAREASDEGSHYQEVIKELRARIEAQQARIEELENNRPEPLPAEEIEEDLADDDATWHDKVRLELLLRLMEKDGADMNKFGNKAKASKLIQAITQLPLSTCKNYCTNRNLNVTTHKEEVLALNSLIQALGMSTLL